MGPDEAIDAVNERFGRHAGCRALHARGTLCRGTFTAAPETGRLTRAGHMQGAPVEATVRFSNGSGDPDEPDHATDVRGMGVKLYLPDGTRTDIVAQTSPRFPARTPEAFIELVQANRPGLAQAFKLPLFLIRHPEALGAVRAAPAATKPPVSYATCSYFAIHAFRWLDADGGARWVRYTWRPQAGDERPSGGEAKARGERYLQDEIRERLAREPVRFDLEAQVAADGDEVDDPTAAWPADRETVVVGTLEIAGLETERETGDDIVVFDPTRVVDGIELSNDPILRFRGDAYSVSVARRSG